MSDDDQYIYVAIHIIREFGRAPDEPEFFADDTCDASVSGYFRDTITEVRKFKRIHHSKHHHVELIRKDINDMCERLYSGNFVARVKLTDRRSFEEYQMTLASFEQEMKEVVR